MRRGVTLIEALIVMAIISLMAAIAFPAMSAGLDSVRLRSSSSDVAAFLSAAVNRAERREQTVELLVEPKRNRIEMFSSEPGFHRSLTFDAGIKILLPGISDEEQPDSRSVIISPGGACPALNLVLKNSRGVARRISLDPITEVPTVSPA